MRPSAADLLAHPVFSTYHDPANEPAVSEPFPRSYENVHTTDEWKALVLDRLQRY